MEICNGPSLLFFFITRMFLFFFCVILSALQLSDRGHPHLSNASDHEALLRFMSATSYESLYTSWKPNVSFCEWTGVICSHRRQRVVSLNVSSMALQGTISPLLGNLSFLRILDLSDNSFHGHIPYQLGNLFRLNTLYLNLNHLQGSIPPTLGRCRSLQRFSLETNNLTGTIPVCLGNISSLDLINLDSNNLHGSVPSELGMLSQVTEIFLYDNHLTGQIPSPLFNCTNLQELHIGTNQLTGHIPRELCSKNTQLEILSLGDNQLSGSIPVSLFNCTKLEGISFPYNQLSGVVPMEFGKLTQLKLLNLGGNQFVSGSTTSLPILTALTNCSTLGNLFRLNTLYLFLNHLQGSIPPTLGRCRSLQSFSLKTNNITGTIPAWLGNISSLEYINLGRNNLHGSVPSELGQVTYIYLSDNYLTGQIPSSLSNCTNLLDLDLGGNQFTGHIPADLCSKNTQLEILFLGGNQLSGSIPASLFNCTNLQGIDFGYNQLTGVMPIEFGKLTHLQLLSLGDNKLVSGSTTSLPILTALTNCSILQKVYLFGNNFKGRLPFSIGHLSTKLDYINLEGNELTGEIPPQIGNLTSLVQLILDSNNFTGVIPSSLNMLQKLQILHLESNYLQRNIPLDIGQLKSLGLLYLSQNKFYGRIPDSISDLQQLRYLDLSHNQLSGNIPANLGRCVNLLQLDLSYNKFTGQIPPEVASLENIALFFNLSNNLLHGPIPLELSKMTMLQAIDISANQLSGYIPSTLQSCKELEYLNLSHNALEGPIPVTLSELQSLEDMDLSFNNLSGGIPLSLENLKMLHHCNFSFNKLSGEVPKGGVFKKLGAMAFMGNPGLCGPWVSMSPCYAHKHKSVWHVKRVIIPVVVVAVIVLLCLFLGILLIQNRKRHIHRVVETFFTVGHRRISYGEIIIATNEFSDTNLLGVGSFGKVYKGVLNDGTIVAIKVLNLENEGAHKSFDRECKVLGKVRHRNLIRIITSYSDLQMKALIFPLMENGSLEKWLYPDGEEESGLNLFQRLNIAIDIAQGMEYLHHHCFVQVLHCDLKPSNVLLGEDMTAHLTDFGIASILFANSEDSTLTSTHALKGSVGYIPPEYGLGGRVTTKGDVYSYGIVLLEMLTRKKPNHNMFVEGLSLQKWVDNNFPNQVGEVVDKSLLRRTSTSIEEVKELSCLRQLVSVGLFCTKESPEGRPSMINIVHALQSIKDTFLGIVSNQKFQSDITHLLGSTSTTHNNNGEGQSSSTF